MRFRAGLRVADFGLAPAPGLTLRRGLELLLRPGVVEGDAEEGRLGGATGRGWGPVDVDFEKADMFW
jgi:hypothetical protein